MGIYLCHCMYANVLVTIVRGQTSVQLFHLFETCAYSIFFTFNLAVKKKRRIYANALMGFM